MKKEPTSRTLQAMATKKLILTEGRKLILKKGFNNVTVDEISKKANITVGTFYHYFKSKDELIMGLLPQVQEYHRQYGDDFDTDSFTKIVRYFSWFNTEIDRTNTSPDLIAQLFSSKTLLLAIEKDRVLPGIELVIEGQVKGEITRSYTPSYISSILFSAGRGICFHWAISPDSISLSDATNDIVSRLTRSFLTEENEKSN